MKSVACTLPAIILACLAVRAAETGDTTETQIRGFRQTMFREVGPWRSVLVGVDVWYGTFVNNDVIHGIRPIFLDAQGREQPGNLHGKDTGRAPIRVKAKKGYAVGAISVKTALCVDCLSLTFMKLDKGRLDPLQSYESQWLGGPDNNGATRLGGTGEAVVGLIGSQNSNSELNGLGLVLSNKPIAAGPQKRLPLPDEAAQAKSLKLAKEVYATEWAAAKSPTQKRDLADKLLHAAEESQNDLPSRYILLKLARDVATQATSGLQAFEAIDRMGEQFQIDDVEMKAGVLTSFSKRAKLPADHKSIADQAVGLIDGAIAHDEVELAVKLCDLALPEAHAAKDADLVREVKSRSEECRVLVKAYREMQEAAAVLDKTPDDPAANLTVGKYYCFQKGDWEKGLPMLALGRDQSLQAVAVREITGVAKTDDQMKLGDAWWDLAEKEQSKSQATLRARANYWYEQALPGLSGLAKAKIEKRIKESDAAGGKSEEPAGKRSSKYLPGLVGQYYNDLNLILKVKTRVDDNLDFDWGSGAPDPAINTQAYTVRWIGYLKVPRTGRYIFRARSQFDCQLMIENVLVFANPVLGRRVPEPQGEVTLTAGYHFLVAQFAHNFGPAQIHVDWQPPGAATSTIVPAQNLFHDQKQEQAAGLGGK
jgi:hypothetical protein